MISNRHILQRISPSLDWRWLVVLGVAGVIVLAVSFVRWQGVAAPLELVALGPEGTFVDTLDVPTAWVDTATATLDAVVRAPLILGVRNAGTRRVRPERLTLSLPVRYRITNGAGEELHGETDPGSPLIRYTLEPGFEAVEPGRLPVLLPAHDTLWLEVVVPRFYCVALADSIPDLIAAPPPPTGPMSRVRLFYSFEGGDLRDRRTGTLAVWFDSTLLDVTMPDPLPTFDMEANTATARPAMAGLTYVGARRSRCGQPEDPMELLSSVWETVDGGRFIALDYGGAVRKHLYDLDGDGVIERESWDPDGDGTFEATRQARIPTPDFLLPGPSSTLYPLARFDSLPPDSVARLDPFRKAMAGPGPVPGAADDTLRGGPPGRRPGAPPAGFGRPGMGAAAGDVDFALPPRDSLPAPRIRPAAPLGRPARPPPDTGSG